MPMSFEYIPSNVLLPLFYAEVRPAPEPFQATLRMCVCGHANDSWQLGIGTLNTPYLLSRTEAEALFGSGSQLNHMYRRARQNFPWAEIWGIAMPTDASSIRAKGYFTVVKDATAKWAGLIRLWIAGRPVELVVKYGYTKEQIANMLQTVINNSKDNTDPEDSTGTDYNVVCKNDDAVSSPLMNKKTILCKWMGGTGNEIRMTYIGPHGRASNSDPVVKRTKYFLDLTQLSGGVGAPESAATFPAIGDRPFDIFVIPNTAQSQLDRWQEFMNGSTGRWSPYQQLYGHVFSASIGSYQSLYDLGKVRNDPHMTILGIMQSIMPSWEWASALGALACEHWANPPELSRPLQTLILEGMYVGSDSDDSFIDSERQTLLSKGISTFHVNPDTTCAIDRIRTTRQTNVFGDPDPSWADAITMFQAQYFVRAMRAAITNNFPRSALANDDRGVPGVASPPLIKLVVIHEYLRMESLMLVENSDIFIQALVVERDTIDHNRVNILMRPDFVNQLRVVATIVETHLELDASDPMLQLAA